MGLRHSELHEDTVSEVGRTPWSAAGPWPAFGRGADEGVGRGPGGPPY